MADFNEKFNEFNNTEDTTAAYAQKDIDDNRVMSVLAYLSWLVLIPLLAAKQSPFARFHTNQGLVLALAEIVVVIALSILQAFPLIGWVFKAIRYLFEIACVVMSGIGIINAINGRAKELPLVGSFHILN